MLKVIQITDTHLSEPGQTLWGMDPYKRLEAAFEDIRTFHSDARACIISGDLTLSAIIFISIITDKHHGDMQKTGLSAGLFYVRTIQVVIYVFSSIVQAKP